MKVELLFPPLEEDSIFWFVKIGKLKIGIINKNVWCLGLGDVVRSPLDFEDMMPLLPLLEVSRRGFIEYFERVGRLRPEIAGMIQTFPETLLLKFACEKSVSDYWPSRAIEWINAEPILAEKLSKSLFDLLKQGWLPQRLRQQVSEVVRRIGTERPPRV
ncbi:hypothetical protein [Pandoraea pulmonicola]|uniref:Uncharacterized protein n=1 Tax=Pandoraea pulmonicola TaxID=93221 RepID=A0ABN4ENP5_PANPU|nr:hypothetical protein [Pandoraea pulmonicola]AJC21060.1 hypothetical protein RO07_12390 [Pandoraea pulmonicola]